MRWTTTQACAAIALMALTSGLPATPAKAQVTAYKQAVAEVASQDDEVAAFYRQTNYAPLWTGEGPEFTARRAALMAALADVTVHGLPASRYDAAGLMAKMQAARTTRDLGMVEVALSLAFVHYAHDISSGILTPGKIDAGILREVPRRDGVDLLKGLATNAPTAYLASLAPHNPEYRELMKEKIRYERLIAAGGWGPTVPAKALKPGESGEAVVALRNRLIAMGYMERSVSRDYDAALEEGIRTFQHAHGLNEDGVAGPGTVEEINISADDRLKSIIVALERERWMNIPRGKRHILVNQTDFTAKIIDDGRVTFQTRSVIGMNQGDRRSPEFSDEMEHMIVNPSWHVPRSIIVKEYLPQLQANPNAARHLIITDSRGRRVDRETMDFTQFSTRNFPFDMRQAPGDANALGKVKFMFPNSNNIYLHDTPAKNLFAREVRAYSHGCIRLADPFDFAYALLSAQTDDPQGVFQAALRSGRETKIDLVEHVPVHLIYRTAQVDARGKAEFRRDVYGRDGKIWDALQRAGVALPSVQG
ncbi:L,D-transpeptidase family protein [Seohaeicola zhoushanensis]|nr:L,D-transpeptidase family protein [Seohaeicola zhoushanensis]